LKKQRAFYESQFGHTQKALLEEKIDDGMMEGYTENYVRIVRPYDAELVNKIVNVQLGKINGNGLIEVEEVLTKSLEFFIK
jgi:threonylcarbamoyladenosine tRNA methylthiotransferase MtaB